MIVPWIASRIEPRTGCFLLVTEIRYKPAKSHERPQPDFIPGGAASPHEQLLWDAHVVFGLDRRRASDSQSGLIQTALWTAAKAATYPGRNHLLTPRNMRR